MGCILWFNLGCCDRICLCVSCLYCVGLGSLPRRFTGISWNRGRAIVPPMTRLLASWTFPDYWALSLRRNTIFVFWSTGLGHFHNRTLTVMRSSGISQSTGARNRKNCSLHFLIISYKSPTTNKFDKRCWFITIVY